METDLLLKDPVFQLNLLLWMAKEQPSVGYRVRPVFFESKFGIIYIEQPFAFPDSASTAIKASSLEISEAPEPELILGRQADFKALYFEAKANSFSAESTTCKQARGHLVATGAVFAEVLTPLKACLLCYLTPEHARAPMRDCLSSLKIQLGSEAFSAGEFSCHGLSMSGSTIEYSVDDAYAAHVGHDDKTFVIIDNVVADTDPSPLILVFSDEDCSTLTRRDFYRRVVLDQIRAILVCGLHAHPVGSPYEVAADQLLRKTTDGLFDYLGRQRQKGLRQLVKINLFKKIQEYWKDRQAGITVSGDVLKVAWEDNGNKEAFLDWLEDRSTRFDATKPDAQLPLFGE